MNEIFIEVIDMKEKKSIFTLLVAVSASICLTACDLTSFLGGGSKKNNSSFESSKSSETNNSVSLDPSKALFTFTSDVSDYPTYFRSTSYGDFDYSKKTFKEPDYFDASSMISADSVHPLCYLAYKIKRLDDLGMLAESFRMTNYEITYNQNFKYYPTPECQVQNDMNAFTNSDAHYIETPVDNKYSCQAAYVPAYSNIIDVLNAIPLNGAIGRDERAYYQYALAQYTLIPDEYMNVIDGMIA